MIWSELHGDVKRPFEDGRQSCFCRQTLLSADMFLGVPFNIASYALLTHLVAEHCGLEVGEFIHTFGDAHIYENHLDAVDEQLTREPLPHPRLMIDHVGWQLFDNIVNYTQLVGYQSHGPLKGEVAV